MSGSLKIPTQDARCPYCGHMNRVGLESSYVRKVVCCDCEEGGCDQDFVVIATAQVVTSVDAYKIEGLYPEPAGGAA